MISLLLPYWDRQAAADKALYALAQHYLGLDLEVIVVDDGSPVPFVAPDVGLDIKVIRLPRKDEPKSPVTPWNVAAGQARGDVLVLSCIEVIHDRPILGELAREATGNNYIMAAAWCPEENRWHTHSTVTVPGCPRDAGLGFCAALTPALYWKAGGWDEDYREGAGYEDRDWIKRLARAGARFIKRDDLAVIHPKEGASISWGAGKFARNLALYREKWPETLINFVCVQAGNYCGRGVEYVNTLEDMVRRNMPAGVPWKFWCVTDSPEGLHDEIQVIPLPADLEKWWGKLYLFKRGLFPDGSRMVFMDLDTIIVGPLEKIIAYDGDFATLNDFYFPERVGPAVMLWRAGDYAASIWDEWVAQGKPRHPMGDLWWIGQLDQGRFARLADKLQNLYPGAFCSFKAGCHPYPPQGTSVVCFHGHPRPHECVQSWVGLIWKEGGGTSPEITKGSNTEERALIRNIRASSSLPLAWLEMAAPHAGIAVIAGGGPSLKRSIPEIKELQARGGTVFALNGAAKFLEGNGVRVDHQIIVDGREESAQFVNGTPCYLASTCHPLTFSKAAQAVLFHPHMPGIENVIPETAKPIHLIGGGSSVGMLALSLVYVRGYRTEHLFGFDSSYEDGAHHAYKQPLNDGERMVDAECAGRTFRCAAWMVTQAQEFQQLSANLAAMDCEVHVHGTGLLPTVAWQMTNNEMETEQ